MLQNQETDTETASRRHEGRTVEQCHSTVRVVIVMTKAAAEISRIISRT